MKKKTKAALLLFLFLFFIGCSQKQEKINAQPASSVSQDQYTWDFGKVKEGQMLTHTFILKNDTPKTLKIGDINTSCGCTASQVKKKTILPRETTSIEVSFNSKGYSGATQQFVYVNTDSIDKPIIRYIIKSNVVK